MDNVAGGAGYDTDVDEPQMIVATIIQTFLSLLGIIFLVLMIYGGYLWMTDRGAAERVEKSKKVIQAAVIGLIIVMGAYAISYFVIEKLGDKTLDSVQSTLETQQLKNKA